MALRQEDSALMLSLLKPKLPKPEDESRPAGPDQIPALDAQRLHWEGLGMQGDEIATRILALTPADWAELDEELRAGLKTLGAKFTAGRDGLAVGQPAAPLLDALALNALGRERPQNAAVLLAVRLAMSATDREKADALCSIAFCAVCLHAWGDAYALAKAALDLHSMLPRARCIIGLCALRSGDRKTAQFSLALGARMARSNRDDAELLQAAQRLLLVLHFEE